MTEDSNSFFLGGLKSEFDEGYSLSGIFSSLVAAADNIRNKYVKYEIESDVAAELFAKLKITDINGNEWTIGASSGSWYRRYGNEKKWISSNPPIDIEADVNSTFDMDSIIHTQTTNNNTNVRSTGLKIEEFISEFEDNDSNKDWLLQEWGKFEEEVRNLEENNVIVEKIYEKEDNYINSNEDKSEETIEVISTSSSEIGLPDNVSSINDQPFVLDDFFIKPEDRDTDSFSSSKDNDVSADVFDKPPIE